MEKLEDYFREFLERRIRSSFTLANVRERRERLAVVEELSVLLHGIRKSGLFATGIAEQVLYDVIEGEWRGVRESARDLLGALASDEHQLLWTTFVETALAAADAGDARSPMGGRSGH